MVDGTPRKIKSLTELGGLAEEFLQSLVKLDLSGCATVVGMSGDLGSGKTAFTKCVADVLGIKEVVTSPTFVLEKIYKIPEGSIADNRFTRLVHIDAYRLESGDEMRALGWEALLKDSHNLIFLEWPENVHSAIPSTVINLSFTYVDDSVRHIAGFSI